MIERSKRAKITTAKSPGSTPRAEDGTSADLLLVAEQSRQSLAAAFAGQTSMTPIHDEVLPDLSAQEVGLLTPLANLPIPVTVAEAARAYAPLTHKASPVTPK
jgi:hypothetical protein